MKRLDFDLICRHFSSFDHTVFINRSDSPIDGVRILKNSQAAFDTNLIYICPTLTCAENIPDHQEVNLICFITDVIPESLNNPRGKNILFLSASLEPFFVLEEINELIIHQNQMFLAHSRLLEALISNNGLQHIIDIASELMENPLILSDISYKMIAHTQDACLDDRFWKNMVEQGYQPINEITYLKNRGIMESLFTRRTPVFLTKEAAESKYAVLVTLIFINHKPVGTLAVYSGLRSINKYDKQLLTLIADVIASEMKRNEFYQTNDIYLEESLLNDLISENYSSEFEIINRASVFNWNPPSCHILLVDLSHFDKAIATVISLKDELIDLFPGSKSVIYQSDLVIIIEGDHQLFFASPACHIFESILKKNGLKAAFSRRYTNLTGTHVHYAQARRTLKIGSQLNLMTDYTLYEDIAIYDYMESCFKKQELKFLCHPILLNLLDYDKTYNTGFASTLYALVRCNGNMTAASKELAINYNTIKYRLKKIEEIIQTDLTQSDLMLQLDLSYRILVFLGEIALQADGSIKIN